MGGCNGRHSQVLLRQYWEEAAIKEIMRGNQLEYLPGWRVQNKPSITLSAHLVISWRFGPIVVFHSGTFLTGWNDPGVSNRQPWRRLLESSIYWGKVLPVSYILQQRGPSKERRKHILITNQIGNHLTTDVVLMWADLKQEPQTSAEIVTSLFMKVVHNFTCSVS